MKIIDKAKISFAKIRKVFSDKFDFGDFLSLTALSMIFYGFYIWKPMVAFVIVGFILLILSAGDKK